jgi:hypothetical protein
MEGNLFKCENYFHLFKFSLRVSSLQLLRSYYIQLIILYFYTFVHIKFRYGMYIF